MNEFKPVFPPVSVDPHLMALTADMAVIKATTSDTNKRLEELQGLSRVILETKAQSDNSERRIAVLETRCETIDRHVDKIDVHNQRIETLEKDLIPNGELRMKTLESLRTWIFSLLGSGAVLVGGWVAKEYGPQLLAILKH